MKINFFNKNDTSLFAVHTGQYAGEFWALIKKDDKKYYFLSTPTMLNRDLNIEIFESGQKAGIVNFVEFLPKNVYKICVDQYNKNLK